MRNGMVTLVAGSAIALTLASCTKGGTATPTAGPSSVTQLPRASAVFDVLKRAGLTCPSPKLVNGAAVCGGRWAGRTSTLSVATYASPGAAKQEFLAHCAGDTWNLFRNGQNWRGAFSTSGGGIDPVQARPVAAALSTDLIHGCSGSS